MPFPKSPAYARPWIFHFALNGNLSKEGIIADLEAKAGLGIGGLLTRRHTSFARLYFKIS